MHIRSKRNHFRNTPRGYSRYTGRPMKDESGQHGGGTPAPTGDNGNGNSGDSNQNAGGGDNNGQDPRLAAFWDSPVEGAPASAPSGESTGTPTPSAGQQQQESNPAAQLQADIQALSFGNGIMSEAVVAELAEGKTEGFQAAMNQFGQTAVQNTMRLMIPIMAQVRDQLRSEFEAKMGDSFTQRDNSADLLKAIPSAANPAVRPIVDSIFNRAMTLTKNDRAAAISMTKDMLRLQTQTLGEDIGIPPRSAGDSGALQTSNTNWLEELAGR